MLKSLENAFFSIGKKFGFNQILFLKEIGPPMAERFCALNLQTGGAGFNPDLACQPSRSEFTVVFSETRVNTG